MQNEIAPDEETRRPRLYMHVSNSLPLPKLDAKSASGSVWLAEQLESERLARATPIYRSPYNDKAHKNPKITFLDLFFDLSFVACLTTFQGNHSDATGTEIGVLVAFITVLWWSWTSNVLYAIGFGRIDVVHRFWTFAYIAVFAFLGAYSLGFDPSILKVTPDYALAGTGTAAEPSETDIRAWETWPGVCIAFALGRLIMFLQYLIASIDGGRRRLSLATILPMIGCNISGWIAFGVHYMPAYTNHANAIRLGLLYGAIALEMLIALVVARLPSPVQTHWHLLLERMALLTLIILGEGFIGITRGVSIVVTNFGFDSASYIQLFCGLALYVLFWSLLFEPLSMTSVMSDVRTTLWTLLHLGLHLSLLLWLDSLFLVLLTSGLHTAFKSFDGFLSAIKSSTATYLDQLDNGIDAVYAFNVPADQLPSYATSLELIGSSLAELNSTLQDGFATLAAAATAYGAAHPNANLSQYRSALAQSFSFEVFGGLLIDFATTYGFEPDDRTAQLIGEKFSGNASLAASVVNVTTMDFGELVSSIDNAVLPSSRFILPFAGGILVFSSALTVLQRSPQDRTDYMLLVPRTAAGVLLCLLALLDIGKTELTYQDLPYETSQLYSVNQFPPGTAPIYLFLYDGWLLPFQVFLLSALVMFEGGVLFWAKRAYKEARRRRTTSSPGEMYETANGPSKSASDKAVAENEAEESALDEQRQHDTEVPMSI